MSRDVSRAGSAARIDRRMPPSGAMDPTAAQLKGHAPLVPVQSAASRALIGVIAILTFLAALCAGGAELVASHSQQWRSAVDREATIQVRPSPQRDIEADVMLAAEFARRDPGVKAVEILSKAESDRMLEPWLGRGLDLTELPVPRLIVLRLEGARPDLSALRQRLAREAPAATLDDHGAWLSRLSTMANTVVAIGLALAALVMIAAALAVAFATHGAMAGNREVVEVLHLVGADDAFIAREFQRRFFWLGLKGSLVGSGIALAAISALSIVSASWGAGPTGDQVEAMFGSFEVGWRGYAAIGLIAVAVSALTAIVSRSTVKHFLSRSV